MLDILWSVLACMFFALLVALAAAPFWTERKRDRDIDAIRREVFEDKRMAAEVREAFSEYDFTAWEEEMSK